MIPDISHISIYNYHLIILPLKSIWSAKTAAQTRLSVCLTLSYQTVSLHAFPYLFRKTTSAQIDLKALG